MIAMPTATTAALRRKLCLGSVTEFIAFTVRRWEFDITMATPSDCVLLIR
jgi:hypothetical protein